MKRDPERPYHEARGDAAEEQAFHLEMTRERLIAEGLSPEEADAEARRRFGDEAHWLAQSRRIDRRLESRERLTDYLGDLLADLKLAARSLRSRPGFVVAAVASLALAIGATTALFSVVNGVLLRPLDYPAPEQLALLSSVNDERGWDGMPLPQGVFAQLSESPDDTFDLAVYTENRATLLSSAEPRRLRLAAISRNLLSTLGVEPTVGRGFLADDTPNVSGHPCLVSHGFWRSELGGVRDELGQNVRLEGDVASCEVVGVLPPGFAFPRVETEIWTLYDIDPGESLWGSWFLRGVVRVSESADVSLAQGRLDQYTEGWSEQLPFGGGWRFVLDPLHGSVVREVAPALWLLFGAVALVLLIACANLGGMFVARTTERREELALRSALGASRGRIARQLLAENLLLCGLGGGLGALVATVIVQALRSRPPVDLPRHQELQVDGTVLLFTLAITLTSALLSWLAPTFQALRARADLAVGRSSTQRPGRARLRALLVVGESALAVALLVGAGLLTRSFLSIVAVEPGFDAEGVVSVRLELPPTRYDGDEAKHLFFEELTSSVESLPFVESAGLTTGLPLQGVSTIDRLQIQDRAVPEDERPQVAIDATSPTYFEALGVPLLEGRWFDGRDHAESPPVTIINDEIARLHFPDGSPLGHFVIADEDQESLRIVGVVGSVKQYGLRQDAPLEYFLPFPSHNRREATPISWCAVSCPARPPRASSRPRSRASTQRCPCSSNRSRRRCRARSKRSVSTRRR